MLPLYSQTAKGLHKQEWAPLLMPRILDWRHYKHPIPSVRYLSSVFGVKMENRSWHLIWVKKVRTIDIY